LNAEWLLIVYQIIMRLNCILDSNWLKNFKALGCSVMDGIVLSLQFHPLFSFMRKPYQLLLTLSVATASFSSCSRANYAVNATSPVSESVALVDPTSEVAASGTAMVTGTMPTEIIAPAREAAAVLAHRPVATSATTAVGTSQTTHSVQATTIKPKVAVTKTERKALRQELKRLAGAPASTAAEGKSQLVAAILCFFLGGLGVHDFYLGRVGKGILQIFLSLLLVGFILVIIDFVRILIGTEKPKGGEYAKKL
jgi:TM2 domain-containing membrane protein YozV